MPIRTPDGNAPKRRPALRGALVMDVSTGDLRVRAWPRPRGKAKTTAERARQDKFRAVQMATKYMDPQIVLDFRNAVQGTPLLPRDLLTSMLYGQLCCFITETNKVLYPMAFKRDVSESLDALGQTPNYVLVRGEQYWEPRPYIPATNSVGPLVLDMVTKHFNVTGSGTKWQIPYDTITVPQEFASVNTVTGEITILRAGNAVITASTWFSDFNQGDFYGIEIRKNGAVYDWDQYYVANFLYQSPRITTTITLAVGDKITVAAWIGGAVNAYEALGGLTNFRFTMLYFPE